MKLTIGMIVKNEEKWLDKCLSAIKPILDNVDSELIITDTGSTDRTVEIAKKYTDKVLHFDWINDFSAARNTALEIANGEWLMFLDADEIFESSNGIIYFFNSGEYKKYNSAVFVCRNLHNLSNLSDYSDMLAPRLVKILPETRFINPVHESLNTFGDPIKNLDDVALHYGYAYDGKVNILEKKQERNSELLLKRLETEGDSNEFLYVQLFECYSAIFQHEQANEYLEKGRALCIKNNSIILAVIYAEKARLIFRNEKYEDVIAECEQYFSMDTKIRPHTLTTDAEMLYIRAMSFEKLGCMNEAFDDLCKLFDIYADVISGELATRDAYMQSYEFATERNYVPALCELIKCGIETRKYDIAEKYLSSVSVRIIKNSDDEARRRLRLSLVGMFLMTGSENAITALKKVTSGENPSDDLISLCKRYDSLSAGDIAAYTKKYELNANPEMTAFMMKKRYDITELFEGNTDIKRCAYECCRYIPGFYDIVESYSASDINNTDKLSTAADFIGHCITARLTENENQPREIKERLIQKMFRLKAEITDKNKKIAADEEFARLARTIKNSIRKYIADGNFETAQRTAEEYKKLVPDDPEIDELTKMIQVGK